MKIWEFIAQALFYGVHVLYLYFGLIWAIGEKIEEKCKGYWGCSRHLQPSGYGYSVDLGDGQWREFRSSLFLLWGAMIGIALLYKIISVLFKINNAKLTITHTAYFRIIVGLVILFIQHGWHSLIILTIALLGYLVSSQFMNHRSMHTSLTWIFAIAVLLFKESYRLKHLPAFHFLIPFFDQRRYGGIYGWQLPANFLVLRMVSYSLDRQWSTTEPLQDCADGSNKSSNITNKNDITNEERSVSGGASLSKASPAQCPVNSLLSTASPTDGHGNTAPIKSTAASNEEHQPVDYGFLQYMSYVLYAPLYMAGPVITYNDYAAYTRSPQKKESVVFYALRWVACFLLMELLTNRFPFFAIAASGLLPHLSMAEIAVVFYVVLKLMWLKFLLIWRFFRLWAMVDGVLPPENMARCMSNNRSLEGFWKGWHSSYNRWLVRYIYKPCGGSRSRLWSVWLIFLFVALWHDIETKLLLWGLLNAFFLIVEVYAKKVAAESAAMNSLPAALLHMVAVLCGSTYILVLISVNLIGYSVGAGSVSLVIRKLLTWEGFQVLAVSYYFLSIGVKLMMFIQDLSERKIRID